MPAASPDRSRKWYDLAIVVIRCATTVLVEWMRRGGHF
jgi:hypothetical protein